MREIVTLTAAAAFVAMMGFGGTAWAIDLQDGLIAYYPSDVDLADPTDDAANPEASDNDGTLGSTGGADTDDPAYECDAADIAPTFGNVCSLEYTAGESDFVNLSTGISVGSGDFTVSAWVKTTQAGDNKNVIIAEPTGGSFNGDPGWALQVKLGKAGATLADGTGTFGVGRIGVVGSSTVNDGVWHHLAMVRDSDTLRLYVDGAEEASDTLGGLGSVDSGTDLHISHDAFNPLDGLIDEVRIYDRALPVPEIEILASGGALPDPYADVVEILTVPTFADVSGDNGDGGADALDAPDGAAADNTSFTSLGFTDDANNDSTADDPEGGTLVLLFTDNICLDEGTGADDITVFEIGSGEGGSDEPYDVTVGPGAGTSAGSGSGDDVFPSPVDFFTRITITATGNLTGSTSGADIDAVECLFNLDFGSNHIEKENTGDTSIDIGTGVLQNDLSFTIKITNNTGSDMGLADILLRDVVPGEFDLIGDISGISSDNIDCTFALNHPAGAVKKNLSKLEPEFIDIDPGDLKNGEMCTITVLVETDSKNFPRGRSPVFTPTSCDGTIVLNEGVQVWLDDGDGLIDTKVDTLLFVDTDEGDSIELTCNF